MAGTAGKGSSLLGKLLTGIGSVLIAVILILCMIAFLPKVLGYGTYSVTSGSMEPEIPVGSLVLAAPTEAASLESGDIISFYEGDTVVTHRVVSNDTSAQEIITRGDANNMDDFAPIPYSNVIGKVSIHIPYLGRVLQIMLTDGGKPFTLVWLALGLLLTALGRRLQPRTEDTDGR